MAIDQQPITGEWEQPIVLDTDDDWEMAANARLCGIAHAVNTVSERWPMVILWPPSMASHNERRRQDGKKGKAK